MLLRFKPCPPDCPNRTGDCHATCPRYGIWSYVDKLARKREAQTHAADQVLSTNSRARSTRWLRKQKNPRKR